MFLRRPILVSNWSNRVILDALKALVWPSDSLVLQPSRPSQRSFVQAATATEGWPHADVVLGDSVTDNLHPTTLAAISGIVTKRSGNPPRGTLPAPDSMSEALADWLLEVAGDPQRYRLPVKQLSYLFASGAHRARAIARTLQRIRHRPIVRVVDNGSATGMIPWLLRADLSDAGQFDLFEPEARFRTALDRLWLHRGARQTYSVAHTPAENSDFGTRADLVMICHCLLLVAPEERKAVLERAWHALNPGGVLLVNERLKDDSTPASERDDLVHRDELISILPGAPQVFSRRSDWSEPQDLRRVSARSLAHSGVVVSVRDG